MPVTTFVYLSIVDDYDVPTGKFKYQNFTFGAMVYLEAFRLSVLFVPQKGLCWNVRNFFFLDQVDKESAFVERR